MLLGFMVSVVLAFKPHLPLCMPTFVFVGLYYKAPPIVKSFRPHDTQPALGRDLGPFSGPSF